MPFSLSTKIFGVLLILGIASVLLWPSPTVLSLSTSSYLVLPLAIGLLSSRVVKDAPPLDDLAFHRPLPASDGAVFWKVVKFHLVLLGGVSTIILIYGKLSNLTPQEITIGLVFTLIPWIGITSLFGLATSLSSSRQHWKGWGYFAVIVIPAATFLWIHLHHRGNKLTSEFVIGSAPGVLLYPAIWWLVAVKHRWKLGCALGLAVGILSPLWGTVSGRIHQIIKPLTESKSFENTRVTISRKSPTETPSNQDSRSGIFSKLTAEGLEPGEFLHLSAINPNFSKSDIRISLAPTYLWSSLRLNGEAEIDRSLVPVHSAFSTVFTKEMPAHVVLPESLWTVKRPGTLFTLEGAADPMRLNRLDKEEDKIDTASKKHWGLIAAVFRWSKLSDVAATEGGRVLIPEGGYIQISPLEEEGDGYYSIPFTVYRGNTRSHGISGDSVPIIVAVDSEGRATILDPIRMESGSVYLMDYVKYRHSDGTSLGQAKLSQLRDSRLHVFWPQFKGSVRTVLAPPE